MAKAYFETAPVLCPLERTELYMHLFLRQAFAGNNPNQAVILTPQVKPAGFGATAVNDWTIADGLDPNANIVARAEGFSMQIVTPNRSWYSTFNMVFQIGRAHV